MIEIPDLWGPEIKLDVLNPTMILNVQAESIKHRTSGLLLGQLNGRQKGDVLAILFDLLAPAAHNFRHRLMIVRHNANQVYPALITSKSFEGNEKAGSLPLGLSVPPGEMQLTVTAYTQEDFISFVGFVLKSPYTKAVIQSLIARSNELTRGTLSNLFIERVDESSSEDLVN